MAILITGAGGYIGLTLLRLLLNNPEFKDQTIYAVDAGNMRRDYWEDPNLFYKIFSALKKQYKNLQVIPTNLAYDDYYADKRKEAIKNSEIIIHLAGITHKPDSNADPFPYWTNNTYATIKFFNEIMKYGRNIQKILTAVSCSIFEKMGNGLITEESTIDVPITPYAKSKFAVKLFLEDIYNASELPILMLNFATAYGLSEENNFDSIFNHAVRWNIVVNKFVKDAIETGQLLIYGDGSNWRPFIHVVDIAHALMLLIKTEKLPFGEQINIGDTHQNFQIAYVANLVRNTLYEDFQIDVSVSFVCPICKQKLIDGVCSSHGTLYKKKLTSYRVSFEKLNNLGFNATQTLAPAIAKMAKFYLLKKKEHVTNITTKF